jgi:hypothetical protein
MLTCLSVKGHLWLSRRDVCGAGRCLATASRLSRDREYSTASRYVEASAAVSGKKCGIAASCRCLCSVPTLLAAARHRRVSRGRVERDMRALGPHAPASAPPHPPSASATHHSIAALAICGCCPPAYPQAPGSRICAFTALPATESALPRAFAQVIARLILSFLDCRYGLAHE